MPFLWLDYETSGRDPAYDRPIQIGWQLTDFEGQPLNEASSRYVRLPDDVLPSPQAMLVHQIPPDVHQREGMTEAELAVLLDQIIAPQTWVAGYNSRAFDDRFTQHVLYRCLRDPYAWQYAQGRGRFDLYPVVLTYFVFHPEALRWPEDADGKPRFKLDRIGPLNGLDQGIERAHDAAADVTVTARLAALLKHADPDLFAACLARADKQQIMDLIRAEGRTGGLLEVTPFAGWHQGYVRDLWVPFRLAERSNDYVAFDLNVDPEGVMRAMDVALEGGGSSSEKRKAASVAGVHTVRINGQPMLFRRDTLDARLEQRLADSGRDRALQDRHREQWHRIQGSDRFKSLYQKACALFAEADEASTVQDVDGLLYRGGFPSPHDRNLLDAAPVMDPSALAEWRPAFDDSRYLELLFRYRARNFPESLTPAEWKRWQSTRRQKLTSPGPGVTLQSLQQELVEIGERALEPHHFDQLHRFSTWLDNQPPV